MNIVRNLVQRRRGKRITGAAGLVEAGLIEPADAASCEDAAQAMPIGIPAALAERLQGRDPNDPLVREFVPAAAENWFSAQELCDPIGDGANAPVPGIVHRYPDRVLLMPVLSCPAYCRFCFRRHAVGDGRMKPELLDAALSYIANTPGIWEVILSGGDPLILSPDRLGALLGRLDRIRHVKTIRIHSRVPALDPERISDTMIAALNISKPVWIVLHCNHPDEIDAPARAAIARLIDAGIPMLSQTVLLKGINDDPATMEALMRRLIENRIKPYYLHHGDLARGTSHFRTTLAAGRALIRRLRGRLSGIAQPTYVLDIPGGHGKVPAGPCWITRDEEDAGWLAEDISGVRHPYADEIEPGAPE